MATAQRRAEAIRPKADEFRETALTGEAPRGFATALQGPGLQVIAEIKRRSPSAGPLAPDLDAARQARRYAEGGAAALSVLTEPYFFDGSIADMQEARGVSGLPVLRKDFIVDPVQIWESRAVGADAILLIVAALDDESLRILLSEAAAADLDALVEVHDESEAERAMAAGATIVGVNNRDLATFDVDVTTAERLAAKVRPAPVTIAESGVSDAAGATRMAKAGYDAVLVGEALVRSKDPAALIGSLVASP